MTENVRDIAPGSIVVGVDGAPTSRRALDWAVSEAVRSRRPLHLLHTFVQDFPTMTVAAPPQIADLRGAAQSVLDQELQHARSLAPGTDVTGVVECGSAAGYLVDASQRAVTVVVGTQGRRGLARLMLGSTAAQVAAHARCPVVVVPSADRAAPASDPRVVVGVDGEGVSSAAVGYAFARASELDLPLIAVHTWWLDFGGDAFAVPRLGPAEEQFRLGEQASVSEALAGWSEKHPDVTVRRRVERGDAADTLIHEARGAALLVVGSRGRGGFAGLLLGSVSRRVLQLAPCPVAVVRTSR